MQDQTQNPSEAQADQFVGAPEEDTRTWDGRQSYDDTCAIRCQEFILEQFTGQEIDEKALVQVAADNGWYVPGKGTPPQYVGSLLELYGVPVNQYENANLFDLANELAQGHKVVINVDSGELSSREDPVLEEIAATTDVDGADHAVVVSGIDTTDPDSPQVMVSDPGTGEATARYPLEQFLAAWQDSDFTMTATQEPAPGTLPEMANFDYESGHLAQVAGMPYDQFVTYQSYPDAFTAQVNALLGRAHQLIEGAAQQLAVSPTYSTDDEYTPEEADETTEGDSDPYNPVTDSYLDDPPDYNSS